MGASFTIGTCTLKLPKNKIAPGEILKGNLTLNLKSVTKLSEVSLSLAGNEFGKYITTGSKGRKDTHKFYAETLSHEIFKTKPSSFSRGSSTYDFSFKLPDNLPGSISSSGEDYEIKHTYSLEASLKTSWSTYISKHDIDVKSISFVSSDDGYTPKDARLLSTTDSSKFEFTQTNSIQKPGIGSVSQIGAGNRYIDISAFYNFMNEKDIKYKVKLSLCAEHVYPRILGFDKKFSAVVKEYEQEITPGPQKLMFSSSMLLNSDILPSYSGKNASLIYKVSFKIENPAKFLLKTVFEDSKEILIYSSYDSSTPYSSQSKLINHNITNFPKFARKIGDMLASALFISILGGSLFVYIRKDKLTKALEDKGGDLNKLLVDTDTIKEILMNREPKKANLDTKTSEAAEKK